MCVSQLHLWVLLERSERVVGVQILYLEAAFAKS